MKKGTIAEDYWSNKIEIILEDSEEHIHNLYRSLKPLEKELKFHRGRCSIELSGSRLVITGYGRDITSLRSVINGLLKCLYLTYLIEFGELE